MKKIEGYSDYLVDKHGNVYSIKGKKIKPKKSKTGYLYVGLYTNTKRCFIPIHRLVAIQFLPNPENKCCVNHKDGDKENNNVNNLEWVTMSENMKHAYKNELVKIPGLKGEKHGRSKLSNDNIRQIREHYYFKRYTQKELSLIYDVTQSHISDIINNKTRE